MVTSCNVLFCLFLLGNSSSIILVISLIFLVSLVLILFYLDIFFFLFQTLSFNFFLWSTWRLTSCRVHAPPQVYSYSYLIHINNRFRYGMMYLIGLSWCNLIVHVCVNLKLILCLNLIISLECNLLVPAIF